MAQYPQKQIGKYQVPWTVVPPTAGRYTAGAGAEQTNIAAGFSGLVSSFAGLASEVGEGISKENVQKAQNFVIEDEKLFRKLEKEGTLDWTPPMMQKAWTTQGNLAGRDFNAAYEERMTKLSPEELQDIDAPQKIYQEMFANHLETEKRRNTWFDDGFNSHAVDKGKARVEGWIIAAAKARKAQAIYDISLETGGIFTDELRALDGMDTSTPEYHAARTAVITNIRKTLAEKMEGTEGSDDSGMPDTGWYGSGTLTANNNAGTQAVLKAGLSALDTGEYDPTIAVDIFEELTLGGHRFADIDEVKLLLSEHKTGLPKVKAAWEERKNASWWNEMDISITNEPLSFSEEHQNRQLSRTDADTQLNDWYINKKTELHNHFGLEDNANDLGDWKRFDSIKYNAYALKLENTYRTYKTRIKTQQQIHQTVEPTMAEVKRYADAALAAAQSVGQGYMEGVPAGDPNFPKGHVGVKKGAHAGAGNYKTLTTSTLEILQTMVDPRTCTLEDPDGKPFGSNAEDWFEQHVHDAFYVPTIGNPEAQGNMAIILGGQNATQQGLIGTEIVNSASRLMGLGSLSRAGEGLDADLDPRFRSVERGFEELPKDAGEISREDLEDSDILRSFEVYEVVRGRSNMAATVLGIKDTPVSNIFYEAWRLRDNKAPAAARLAQAFTRLRIEDLGGETPLTESGREVFSKALREKGLDGHAMSIASTVLNQVWRNIDPGLSSQGKDEALKKWGKTNIGYEEEVFVRIGSPEDFYEEQVSETEFFTLFKEDLEEMVNDPNKHVQFTVLRVAGKTQVIPHAVDDSGNVTDLFDHNIKSVYSQDDLKYLYDKYKADVDYAGFQSTSSLNPALKRTPRTVGKGTGSPVTTWARSRPVRRATDTELVDTEEERIKPLSGGTPSPGGVSYFSPIDGGSWGGARLGAEHGRMGSARDLPDIEALDEFREKHGMALAGEESGRTPSRRSIESRQSIEQIVRTARSKDDPLLQSSRELVKKSEAERDQEDAEALKLLEARMILHNEGTEIRRHGAADQRDVYFPGIPTNRKIESLDEITTVDGIYNPQSALMHSNKIMNKNLGITETREEYAERMKLHGEAEAELMSEELGEQTEAIKKLEEGQEKSLLEASAILNEQGKELRKRQAQLDKDDEKLKQEDPEVYRQVMIDRAMNHIYVAWMTEDKSKTTYFIDKAVTAFLNLSEEDRNAFLDIKGVGDFWSMEVDELRPHMAGQLVTFRDKFLLAIHRRAPMFIDEDE